MTEIKAKLNYLRISPRKVRLVADLIRGKDVREARSILNFTLKRAAKPILKLLNSAIASAKNDFHKEENNLYIKTIKVDEGPALKRWMPRARGRADLIKKRTSHITLILSEKEEKVNKMKEGEKNLKEEEVIEEEKPKKTEKKAEEKKKKTKKLIYKIKEEPLSKREDIKPKRFFRRKAF